MPEDTSRQRRGPSDPTDYSSTIAPETQRAAEDHPKEIVDHRLRPGGAAGTPADPGMSSLDRHTAPHGGEHTGQSDAGGSKGD